MGICCSTGMVEQSGSDVPGSSARGDAPDDGVAFRHALRCLPLWISSTATRLARRAAPIPQRCRRLVLDREPRPATGGACLCRPSLSRELRTHALEPAIDRYRRGIMLILGAARPVM